MSAILDQLKESILTLNGYMEEISAIWQKNQAMEKRLQFLEQAQQNLLQENQKLLTKITHFEQQLLATNPIPSLPEKEVLPTSSTHPLLKRLGNIKLGIENLHNEEKLDAGDVAWLIRYFDYLEELGKILIENDLTKEWFNEMLNSILSFLVQFRTSDRVIDFVPTAGEEGKLALQFIQKLATLILNIPSRILENDGSCCYEVFASLLALYGQFAYELLPILGEKSGVGFTDPEPSLIVAKAGDFPVISVTAMLYVLLQDNAMILEMDNLKILCGKLVLGQREQWQGWRVLEVQGQ